MTDEQPAPAADLISFDPFRLCPAHRTLEKAGSPIHLIARASEILIVLVERAGEVVSKKKLMARVWPDVTVDEGNLRFHIAALCRALEDGQSGARYVTTPQGEATASWRRSLGRMRILTRSSTLRVRQTAKQAIVQRASDGSAVHLSLGLFA